ncbi:hypothetical protein [Streptomyces olivochromogenes]|uniref:hypothetical protein n=1 Tax=Streptomyces olivochromogenes TaxID=1963 RepID=UPI001F41CDE6|nr:hypothetical protein [Streptomyces olivochromogenes]MCF3135755.1 hypothetical protein [Streptomyces olivochromogenes]
MGSVRLTLCTGLLAAVALTPAAHAADGADVSVTPSSPAPGGTVALRVGGCDARTATAVSDAFAGDLTLSGSGGTLTGESRVRTSAAAGPHDVTITCGATRLTGTITVSTAGQSATSPDSPASPVAPVPAGGGGTAHFASADAQVPLPGTAHAVIGLVLAGLAAVTVGLRSARRSRGAD